MNTKQLIRHGRRLFTNEFATPKIRRHNVRSWVRMVCYLGPNWRGRPQPKEQQ